MRLVNAPSLRFSGVLITKKYVIHLVAATHTGAKNMLEEIYFIVSRKGTIHI